LFALGVEALFIDAFTLVDRVRGASVLKLVYQHINSAILHSPHSLLPFLLKLLDTFFEESDGSVMDVSLLLIEAGLNEADEGLCSYEFLTKICVIVHIAQIRIKVKDIICRASWLKFLGFVYCRVDGRGLGAWPVRLGRVGALFFLADIEVFKTVD